MKDISPWIHVSERLPKHGEVVMIPYANYFGFKIARFMEHGISRPNEKNFFCHTSDWGYDDLHKYFNVEAWLPIPKPDKSVIPESEEFTINNLSKK